MLVLEDIYKDFSGYAALNGISLKASAGEIVGLAGPNGAGKTTLLSIAAGLLGASSGTVKLRGEILVCPYPEAVARRLGFSSNRVAPLDYLTTREWLLAFGRLSGLKASTAVSRSDELINFFELDGAEDKYVYQCSLGMQKKISLSCALIMAPEVLLLDEPFEGLDHVAVYRLSQLLLDFRATKNTVVLASHDLSALERLCDRVTLLQKGRAVRVLAQEQRHGASSETRYASRLEAALWESVGVPEYSPLSWFLPKETCLAIEYDHA